MLIQPARDLACISDRQFKEFRIRLGRMGWNTSEPVDLGAEHPSLIADTIHGRLGAEDASLEELAEQALMTPEAFVRHYCAADDVTRLSVGPRSGSDYGEFDGN